MKRILCGILASVLVIAVTASTTHFTSKFKSLAYEYTGDIFTMGDESNPLSDDANWIESNPGCTGKGPYNKMCKLTVTFEFLPPMKKQVISSLRLKYVNNGKAFSDMEAYTETFNLENVTIQVHLKP